MQRILRMNHAVVNPVSYTHLDVYKRQVMEVEGVAVRCEKRIVVISDSTANL